MTVLVLRHLRVAVDDTDESTEFLREFDGVSAVSYLASPEGGVKKSSTWMETIRRHGCEPSTGFFERVSSVSSALSEELSRSVRHSDDSGEPVSSQPTGERLCSGNHPVPNEASSARLPRQRTDPSPGGHSLVRNRGRADSLRAPPHRRLGARAGTRSGIPRAAVKTAGGKAHT